MAQVKSFKTVLIEEIDVFRVYEVLDKVLSEDVKQEVVSSLTKTREINYQLEIPFTDMLGVEHSRNSTTPNNYWIW